MENMSDQETKILILLVYRRAWQLIKGGKICLLVTVVLFGWQMSFLFAWEMFSFWSGLISLIILTQIILGAIVFFKFPHRFLSVPLQKRNVSIPDEEGDIKKLYDQCIRSLKLDFPLVDPKTGKLTASSLP